jgi:hypothetical protein
MKDKFPLHVVAFKVVSVFVFLSQSFMKMPLGNNVSQMTMLSASFCMPRKCLMWTCSILTKKVLTLVAQMIYYKGNHYANCYLCDMIF